MLNEIEYDYFSTLINETISKIESRCSEFFKSPVGYWNENGSWASPEKAVNVGFLKVEEEYIKYEIDIFEDEIRIIHFPSRDDWEVVKLFSTEYVMDNSDEAFFQLSLIQDTTILETTFLRSLIKISLLLRSNRNAHY